MQHLRSLLALFVLPAVAQADVLVVDASGGGDFTDLQLAVDSSAPGDVLLLREGSYGAPMLFGLDLALVADAGAEVVVTGRTLVSGMTEDQTLLLSGIRFEGPIYDPALTVQVCEGAVRLQGCDIRGFDGLPFNGVGDVDESGIGLLLYNNRDVALSGCNVVGGAGSDHLPNTGFTLYAGNGSAAIDSTMTMLTIYRCTVTGGRGGHGTWGGWGGDPEPALRVQNAGACTLVQSALTGGDGGDGGDFFTSCSDGSAGIEVDSGNMVRQLGCVFAGGEGGEHFPGQGCSDGPPTVGNVVTLPGIPRAIIGERVVRADEPATLELYGQPGDVVRVYQSDEAGVQRRFAASGVWMLGGLPYTTFGATGIVPGSGNFQTPLGTVTPPAGGASILYVQGAFTDAQGPILSNFLAVVVLDSSF